MKWYKRDVKAALLGMEALSLEERGAYNTILDMIYDRDGEVPDDDRVLCRWLDCREQRWKRIKNRLVNLGKLVIRNGRLTNPKADQVLADFEHTRKMSSIGGKASAEKRRENNETDPRVLQPLKTQNEKEKKIDSLGGESEQASVVEFTPASRMPPTAEERPVVRGHDLVSDDGSIIIQEEDFKRWEELYPDVTNIRGLCRSALRGWLKGKPYKFFMADFETSIRNRQNDKKVKKLPTPKEQIDQLAQMREAAAEQARKNEYLQRKAEERERRLGHA